MIEDLIIICIAISGLSMILALGALIADNLFD